MDENEMSVFGIPKAEEEIYRHFLRNPGTRADGLRLLPHSPPGEARDRIARLQELGLLHAEDAEGRIFPADPEAALARLVDIRLHALHQELRRVTRSWHVIDGLRAEQGARATRPRDVGPRAAPARTRERVDLFAGAGEYTGDPAGTGGAGTGGGKAAGPRPSGIERRVLMSMCTVGKDEAGARRLGVSVRTYRRHVADLMQTLGTASRARAALLARERGWI
ncbi:DNA-binding response regulator [Streptomyces sp. NBC_01178]|uniref:DNA-binding response regulator n=1 Tax=Streptomyces sp. NBC_01178 TaxID=2903762 RepID=UPI0038652B07|nr:DNA-binding response regulator [Streptomyces sp. NBC_01178]